jgi:predicted dehydrogenase
MSATRRQFVGSSIAAGVAAGAALSAPYVHAQARAKRYRTALIGSGWWGMNILGEAVASNECEVVALCDVDPSQLKAAAEKLSSTTSDQPKHYGDFRELLEKEKPEICIVGTPDHWHPLVMIAAVKAGANVYVEKPIGHTIREGRAMVRAARDTGKVVQVGTHRRVSPHNKSGMEFLKSGQAGKIGMVRAFVHYGGGGPEPPRPNQMPPAGLNWDMWCGPGPARPYNPALHPKGFRQFLDYANGTLGDWGIHWMDQILWWTDEKWPRRVSSVGGRHIKGPPVNGPQGQTTDAPDCQVAQFEFESFTAVWEHRQFAGNNAEKGENVGCYFYGTKGTFHQGWKDGWKFYPSSASGSVAHEKAQLHPPDDQNIKELFADFLDAIKTGRRPVCDIEIAHRSTNMSLLGMLSLKIGRGIQWDGDKEVVIGDNEANKLLSREYRKPWEYPV